MWHLRMVDGGDLWGYLLEVVLEVVRRRWIGVVCSRGGLV